MANRAPRVLDRTADETREVLGGIRVKVLSTEAILFGLMERVKIREWWDICQRKLINPFFYETQFEAGESGRMTGR